MSPLGKHGRDFDHEFIRKPVKGGVLNSPDSRADVGKMLDQIKECLGSHLSDSLDLSHSRSGGDEDTAAEQLLCHER